MGPRQTEKEKDRPSFNYIEHQLDGLQADVLFLGGSGLGKADRETGKRFFSESVPIRNIIIL